MDQFSAKVRPIVEKLNKAAEAKVALRRRQREEKNGGQFQAKPRTRSG